MERSSDKSYSHCGRRQDREIVKIYLEEAGFRTIHAEKGKDAIESRAKDKP